MDESEKSMYAPQLKAAVPDADDKEQYFKVNVLVYFSSDFDSDRCTAGQMD